MSVSEQNNIVDASSVHDLDPFDSDDLFRDIDTNEMAIDGMAEFSSLNEATTAAKSKKEQLWEQFTGQKYIISSPRPTPRNKSRTITILKCSSVMLGSTCLRRSTASGL